MMMLTPELISEKEFYVEEKEDMGSFNHSYLQVKLSAAFLGLDQYIALTELSLETTAVQPQFEGLGNTIIPDIAVYPRRTIDLNRDVLRMSEMPLLVVEILSPMQAVQQLIDKLAIYFALGVQSCWLIYPSVSTIAVYDAPYQARSFNSGDVIDETLNIRLPIDDIFS